MTTRPKQAAQTGLDEVPTPVFEHVDGEVVVLIDGAETTWEDYVTYHLADTPPVLGFRNENGWGESADLIYLVAPGVVVESHLCDDWSEHMLHEDVADPSSLALDLLCNSAMLIALGAVVFGPLFDDDTSLWCPLLPMSPFEASPFAGGVNGIDNPGLHWGLCEVAASEVCEEFKRRVDAGMYPLVTQLRDSGSDLWRRWVTGLLSCVPLSGRVEEEVFPLVSDPAGLDGMSTGELLKTAKLALTRT